MASVSGHTSASDSGGSSRANIALLMQDFRGGGAEKVMLGLAAGFVARGHQVDIVTVRVEGPFMDRVPQQARVVRLGPRRVSRSIFALARYLREHHPDAVLSSLVHVNVAAVLARRLARVPTRIVLREENRIGKNMEGGHPPLIRLAYRLLPAVYPWADHVIAVSEGLAEEVRAVTKLPPSRVSAVYNPVLTDAQFAESSGAPPHPWLDDRSIPVAVAVGRLVPQKDHASLLDAVARLRRDRQIRLVLLGEGPLRQELETRAGRLGIGEDVLFAGFSNDPFAWMRHASLLVHTARWEGFGNVLAEALACGLPVVATDCPSGPAEILDNGRYGRLVPVGDVDAIAEAIAATLDFPPSPDQLRIRGREFTLEALVPKYEAILLGNDEG